MPTSNRTEFALLGLLASGPKSGYDVKKAVESTLRHFWSESFGQIYPVLRRLEDRGWVGRHTEETAGGRTRHIYALSEAGRSVLTAWLAEPVDRVPPRNELLLKLFFGQFAQPADVQQHVLRFREQQRDALRVLEGIHAEVAREHADDSSARYWLMTIDLGMHSIRATIAWADATLPELADLVEEN